MAIQLDDDLVEDVFYELILDWFTKHPRTDMRSMPANIAKNLRRDFHRLQLTVTASEPLPCADGVLDIAWNPKEPT